MQDALLNSFQSAGLLGVIVLALGYVAWHLFKGQITDLRKQVEDGRNLVSDLVERVRELERARIADQREHSRDLKQLSIDSIKESKNVHTVIRELLDVIKNKPCIVSGSNRCGEPQDFPDIETDTVLVAHKQ